MMIKVKIEDAQPLARSHTGHQILKNKNTDDIAGRFSISPLFGVPWLCGS